MKQVTIPIIFLVLSASICQPANSNLAIKNIRPTTASAAAGVLLIENILSRIRNEPQLALARQAILHHGDETGQFSPAGTTDYRLAIRPQAMPARNPIVAQPGESAAGLGKKIDLNQSKGLWERSPSSLAPRAVITYGSENHIGRPNSAGIWERPLGEPGQLSPESQDRLSRSFYRMYGAINGLTIMESVPQSASQLKAESVPAGHTKPIDVKAGAHSFKLGKASHDLKPAPEASPAPNVISGIPLVRIGSTDRQAEQKLAGLVRCGSQAIDGWSVWSYAWPGKKETCLQVYMQLGVVEALRVFDPLLAGFDFVVNIGDNLLALKQKLGEPAFILSEPFTGRGQNYVYPINQVAMQLSRGNDGRHVKVVSLFIFNVK